MPSGSQPKSLNVRNIFWYICLIIFNLIYTYLITEISFYSIGHIYLNTLWMMYKINLQYKTVKLYFAVADKKDWAFALSYMCNFNSRSRVSTLGVLDCVYRAPDHRVPCWQSEGARWECQNELYIIGDIWISTLPYICIALHLWNIKSNYQWQVCSESGDALQNYF